MANGAENLNVGDGDTQYMENVAKTSKVEKVSSCKRLEYVI